MELNGISCFFFQQRTPAKKAKKPEDGEYKFDLGKNRQVTVRSFMGKTYIDIRYAIKIFPHLIWPTKMYRNEKNFHMNF